MATLIDALLSYSLLTGGERRESKRVNLDEALQSVLTNLDEQINASRAIVTHDPLPVVFGDFNHMMQLLQNLISNAVKYRRPEAPPHIHLSSALEHNSVLLSVRDDGQGFDPRYAETIFAPFKRLHGREVPGAGIGLATCKRIVELYDGRIWAESTGTDCGATFWFTLPRFSPRNSVGSSTV
jgi:signal transduction histidine kinase